MRMMNRNNSRAIIASLCAIIVFGVLPQSTFGIVVKVTNDCWTNPTLKNDTDFAMFFNQCLRDTSDNAILRSISEQVVLWANADAYILYITILLAFMPTIAWWNNPDPDLSIKAYRIRFNLLLLLFRVVISYNLCIWLIAAFDLEKPCICVANDTKDRRFEVIVGEIEGTGPWGMPSLECVTGTLISIFLFQHISPYLGLVMFVVVPVAQLCIGYNSLGQVAAGIFIAMMLHIYQVRSALFLRPLDTLFSFIVGYALLTVAKDAYPNKNFSWARVFLSTFVWQIFFYGMVWVYYEPEFIMASSKKSIDAMQDSDFMQFLNVAKEPFSLSPQRPHENKLMALGILALFTALMIVRIAADDFDAWIS